MVEDNFNFSDISESLQKLLLEEFKLEENILNLVHKKEFYKLKSLNINQINKLFFRENSKIYFELNAKKHLTKVLDMIRTEFVNEKTKIYLNFFFQPTNNLLEIKKRNFNFEFFLNLKLEKDILNILKNLEDLNMKPSINKNIFVLNSDFEKFLFEKYSIISTLISKDELQEMLESTGFNENDFRDMVLISEDDLYLDIPTYSLKEFEKIIFGNIIKNNKDRIIDLIVFLDFIKDYEENLKKIVKDISGLNFNFNEDFSKLKTILIEDKSEVFKYLTSKALNLDNVISVLNNEIKEIIKNKQLSLGGDELLELLNSGNMQLLQNKFQNDIKQIIKDKEGEILDDFKNEGININYIFMEYSYPVKIDEEIKDIILKNIDENISNFEFKNYQELGKYDINKIRELVNFGFFFDLILGLSKFKDKFSLILPEFSDEIKLLNGKNIYLDKASSVNYAIGSESINEINLGGEKVCILTGANSGGKTTLLEMILQSQILVNLGLGISAEKGSKIKLFDEVIYLKKFTGTQGSGAFEQTIRNLISIIDSDSSKLILIDEFEAVTEPGAAAKILVFFLKELVTRNSFCVSASHLGFEILKFIDEQNITGIRIDGISANGIDENGNLITNHQPEFSSLGKSTPELIIKRILQDDNFWDGKSNNLKLKLNEISDSSN